VAHRDPRRQHPPTAIVLAGIPARREHVAWIANELDNDPTARRLRDALERDVRILGLDVAERDEAIIRALDEPPAGLEELRATLLQEHTWRQRHMPT
jgi:hypothetical protein